jgi:hypothetical protein
MTGGGRTTEISTDPACVGIGMTITNPKSIAPKSDLFILLPSLSICDVNVLLRRGGYDG